MTTLFMAKMTSAPLGVCEAPPAMSTVPADWLLVMQMPGFKSTPATLTALRNWQVVVAALAVPAVIAEVPW